MYLWIGVGSALGGMARYGLSGLVAQHIGETFPWGTLIVNVSGSLVIGLFAALTEPEGLWLVLPEWRQLFMTGICGGYTTFSSFSLQTLNQVHEGDWAKAAANIALSVVLCLVAVWMGHTLGSGLNRAWR